MAIPIRSGVRALAATAFVATTCRRLPDFGREHPIACSGQTEEGCLEKTTRHLRRALAARLWSGRDRRGGGDGDCRGGRQRHWRSSRQHGDWTGRPLKEVPPDIVARTLRQYANSPDYGGKPASEHHFAALKRLLDKSEPDYAD